MEKDLLTLRDTLAIDRTRLANQRTLLAFLRTGLYMVIAALAVFQIKEEIDMPEAVWVLVGVGITIIIIGIINYLLMRRKILRGLKQKS